MQLQITRAGFDDASVVSSILQEAADWTLRIGVPLWRPDETSVEAVSSDVAAGLFFLALVDGQPQGTLRFQLGDAPFWPELTDADSAFVHRLAVRRSMAGAGLSSALLAWAADRTRSLGRRYLRLDCEIGRPKLRAFYERHGFRHHSDTQAGPYLVSRFELDLQAGVDPALVWRAEQSAVTRGLNIV